MVFYIRRTIKWRTIKARNTIHYIRLCKIAADRAISSARASARAASRAAFAAFSFAAFSFSFSCSRKEAPIQKRNGV